VSIGSFINGGTNFLRNNVRTVAIWTAIYVVVLIAMTSLMRPMFGSLIALQQQAAARQTQGVIGPPVFPTGMFGTIFVMQLVGGLLSMIAFAAVVRAASRPADERFAYLRVGMDELRLIGLSILLALMIMASILVGMLLIGVIGAALGAVVGSVGGVLAGVLAIALLCATLYAEVRISLAGVFTIIERRIVIKDAWRATKGRFWSLFLSYLLLGLVFLVLSILVIAITQPASIAAYASFDPRAIQAASQAQLASRGGFTVASIVQSVLGAVIAVPFGVIVIAGMTATAQEISGLGASVAQTFE
jgi:hypothetical protein